MINWNIPVQYINNELIPRLINILVTPWSHKEALWMVIPLIIILFFIQAYFGRNKSEKLGWNMAFGNAVSLFWITILLSKFLIETTPPTELFYGRVLRNLILISILFVWTFLLLVSDYFHALPKKVAFILSSDIPINVTAYIFIVLIVGEIPLDKTTLFACILLLLLISIFFKIFRSLIKPSESAQKVLLKKRKKKLELKSQKKQERKEKIKEFKEKFFHSLDFLKKEKPRI